MNLHHTHDNCIKQIRPKTSAETRKNVPVDRKTGEGKISRRLDAHSTITTSGKKI